MPITVSQIAYQHRTDIDPERQVDAPQLESLANICVSRAKRTLEKEPADYGEVLRFVLAEVLNSM